jgi:hypothetical protein
MTNSKRWIRGFARLAVVLFVVLWVLLSLWTINENSKHMDLIHHHIFVFAGSTPLPRTWPVLIATSQFMSKPIEEKQKFAREYFEKNIKSLADQYYFDTGEFEAWFVRTATLSLDEAPMKVWVDPSIPSYVMRYREIPGSDMPLAHIWRAFVDKWIVLASLATTLLTMILLMTCFFLLRWVVQGFRRQPF